MKRWIAIVMSVVPLVASAAAFWDGSAVLQRGDSSFESGLFAASDSFAAETVLEVENLDSGQKVRVTVSGLVPGQPDLLVLLSPKAAEALGISAGSVARVRVTLAARAPSTIASLDSDQVARQDPETMTPARASEPPAVETAQVQPAEAAQAAQAAPVESPLPEPAATETEDDLLLKELAARSPQKQLFLPPREDEKFAYQQPVEPPAVEVGALPPGAETGALLPQPQPVEEPALAQPIAAAPSAEPARAGAQPAAEPGSTGALALAEAPPEQAPELSDRIAAAEQPTEKQPRLPAPDPATQPAQAPAQAVAAPETRPPGKTEPAQAPPVAPAPQAAQAAPPAQAQRPPLPAGTTTRYFVQLAAYSAEPLAAGLAASLVATYPVEVRAPAATGGKVYRVMVGPLNRAESGTLLRFFRNRGFPDAFVKQE